MKGQFFCKEEVLEPKKIDEDDGATCVVVEAKATEINEDSGWEEALGTEAILHIRREKKRKLVTFWQKREERQESPEM